MGSPVSGFLMSLGKLGTHLAPRAQQFVEANLHLKGWDLELDEWLVVRGAYEGVGLAGVGGTDHVAKLHVLIH